MTDRSVVLLRHAKAAHPANTADVDRPLTSRGHADAAAAGAWLAHTGLLPSMVICSPAKRTRQTWHGVALGMTHEAPSEAGSPPEPAAEPGGPASPPGGSGRSLLGPAVHYERRVYTGDAEDLLEVIRTTDPAVTRVLLVGHDPSISELSRLLDPIHADPEGLRTSGIAVHRVSGGWDGLAPGAAPIEKWHTARG